MAKYVVQGGFNGAVAPALCPPIPYSPVSTTWGWSNVQGSPGTRPIAAPKPNVHSISASPLTQTSNCSPDLIFPSIYTSTPDPLWRHTPVRPQEIMPIPATNLYNMAGVAQRSRKVGGQYQIAQPPVVQQWPDLLGRRFGGLNG